MSVLSRLFGAVRQPKVKQVPLRANDSSGARPIDYKLDWSSVGSGDGVLQFGDVRVHVCLHEESAGKPSSPTDFVLLKTPGMVEEFVDIARAIEPKNMFELGVFKGGSVVAYNEIFKLRKSVAVDFNPTPAPYLAEYLGRASAAGKVAVHYGVDQADRPRLSRICADEFGGEPLDLVIDDASHFLHETRESFRELFPRLRPGGLYVIEDWAWAHWSGKHWQEDRGGDYFKGKEPVSSFVVELMALCPSRRSLVAEILVKPASVYIVRGTEAVAPGFDPAEYWLNRGDALPRFHA